MIWNMQNLNSVYGQSLFEGRSSARTDRDFIAIKKYILEANPDVILFQEIGDQKSLENILPNNYLYKISNDYFTSKDNKPSIYTAIAFNEKKITESNFYSINTSLKKEGILRDSIGLKFHLSDTTILVFSIHLKSSCGRKTLIDKIDDENSCSLFKRQLEEISNELNTLVTTADLLILGGDFNRRGYPDLLNDPYMKILPINISEYQKQYLSPKIRNCPTFNGSDKNPIDYYIGYSKKIIVNYTLTEYIFHPNDLLAGYNFSDHCPVILDLRNPVF